MKSVQVLFVCLGNICRSPTAQGVFREQVRRAGLVDAIVIDSAGTSGWHIGEPPDRRATAAAKLRGYDIGDLRGRQLIENDFYVFDYVLAMDNENLVNIKSITPAGYTGHVGLFLDFSRQEEYREVPDPYYGGGRGFETVLDLVEDGCQGLLEDIKQKYL